MQKKYQFKETEEQMQRFWEETGIYRYHRNSGKPAYSIDTPPPTISGSLHIGHIFSYTQAEMIARYRRMRGYEVFYPFGFDDNGLPTERLVEQELGIKGKDMPRADFTGRCRKVAARYEKEFKELWKSMGFSVDWTLQYETISPEVQKLSQEKFIELAEKGDAYYKESPVLWCPQCQTSIAQAELESKERPSAFHYLKFSMEEQELPVATTRPELLYGCVCLFIHPEDSRYAQYIGKHARVPLYDYTIPILGDEQVEQGKGTGIVMCATFGDTTDLEWYTKYQLPYRSTVTADGAMDPDVPFIGGMYVSKARKEMVKLLQEKGLLIKSQEISHTISVHERCQGATEIIPSGQWYIDILTNKQQYLNAADEINWHPAHMKNRYLTWVNNLKWDWCISRQRYFGVPFPVWYCQECGKPVFAKADQLPVNPLETPYEGLCTCGSQCFYPESAVMDTWATSSLTPLIHEHSEQIKRAEPGSGDENGDRADIQLPMSMRTHAHEIIRTWTFYSIVRSLYHTGKLPWKDLMINGFVLAKRGEKISKSKNNRGMDPESLIREHSADAMRYWAANARLGTDTFFSPDELTIAKRFITKLWNASKFAFLQLEDYHDYHPKQDYEDNELIPVDRWLRERCQETMRSAAKLLDQYEIGAARHEVDEFFWKDFCDHYLEIAKERLYRPDLHGEQARRSGQRALYRTMLDILKMYAIYVPHITEAVYQSFYRDKGGPLSIHLTEWTFKADSDQRLLGFGEDLKAAVSEMRRQKAALSLSVKAEMDILAVETKTEYERWFRESEKDLLACSHARQMELVFR